MTSPSPSPSPAPPRVLGPLDAACIVIGAIIGVGIFRTPTDSAKITGDQGMAMLAWTLGGFIAVCGALAFAHLGRRYTASAAQYQVLRDAYGPAPAFLFVFCNGTAIQTGSMAVIAVICAQNIAAAVDTALDPVWIGLLSTLLILGVAAANWVGVRSGSRIQNFTVAAKLLTLVVITCLAAFAPHTTPAPAPHEPSASPVIAVLAAVVPTLFSYGGWQHALWISGEVKDPSKNLPRAIIGGVAVVVTVYLLANWSYFSLLGFDGVVSSDAIAADAVGALWSPGRRVVAAAVALSAFGVLNAQLLSGPRLIYGMAADGRFFSPFARLHARWNTPTAAITLMTLISLVLLWAVGFDRTGQLVTGVVIIDSIFFALTGLAVFVLRRRTLALPAADRVTPLIALASGLFFLGELAAVSASFAEKSTREAAWFAVAWILAAAMLYAIRFRAPHPPAR